MGQKYYYLGLGVQTTAIVALNQGPPNCGPRAKFGLRNHFVNNETITKDLLVW